MRVLALLLLLAALPGCAGDGSTLDPLGNPLGPPELQVTPSSLSLSIDEGDSTAVELLVENVGGEPLVITGVLAEAEWLELTAVQLPVEVPSAQGVVLRARVRGTQQPGSLTAAILFESNDDQAPLRELPVDLEVVSVPLLFEPSLENLWTNVFSPDCRECHKGSLAEGDLRLSHGRLAEELVNVPSTDKPELMRVVPFFPDDSYLIHKLEGGPDIVGEIMPNESPPLDPAVIRVVRRWIGNGAPAEGEWPASSCDSPVCQGDLGQGAGQKAGGG